jgi:hypothetical protein
MLWVNDPAENGELTPEQENELAAAIIRWDVAALVGSVGHPGLARSLLRLAQQPFANRRREIRLEARSLLGNTETYRVWSPRGGPQDELIGGFVTRGGPLAARRLSKSEQDALKRLELSPTFVGVERRTVELVIGDMSKSDVKESSTRAGDRLPGEDGGGGWVIRLEEDEAEVDLAGRRTPQSE